MEKWINADALSKALKDRVDEVNKTRRKGATLPNIAWFSGMASAASIVDAQPAADVVPWEFLERYADWFCAQVSYPEFVREAKGFYENTTRAMDGGTIGEQEGDDDV